MALVLLRRDRLLGAVGLVLLLLTLALPPGLATVQVTPRGRIHPQAHWFVDTTVKAVALTFDDGPHPVHTPRLLEVLRRYGVRATFFVVGRQVTQYPAVVRLTAAQGHEIANHSFTHRLPRGLSEAEVIQELEATSQATRACTGQTPRLYRPPGGDWDDRLLATVHRQGYHTILWTWTVYPRNDWKATRPEYVSSYVIKNIRPGDIVLLHDGAGEQSVIAAAVEEILRALIPQGYRFVTVSELLLLEERTSAPGRLEAPPAGGTPRPQNGASPATGTSP